MPYFIYRVDSAPMELVKNLQLLDQKDKFKEAKQVAREFRKQHPDLPPETFRVIFAATPLEAEELLLEKREKPILMEHEK